MTDDLKLAHQLADVADSITMSRFRAADLRVDTKPDMSPVSEADTAVESAIRRGLGEACPNDTVLGEEEGVASVEASSPRRWIIDPVDATRAYVRGVPVFATLIALEIEGRVDIGMVSAPGLQRRWWAKRGDGAFANGAPIHVSRVRRVEDAFITTTDMRFMSDPHRARYIALALRCWTGRALGDFWSHVLVAEGAVDIAVEPAGSIWDFAALQPIVEEAGGRFTDYEGVARIDAGRAISTNGLLHDAVIEAMRV